jgi:hypothetical protein
MKIKNSIHFSKKRTQSGAIESGSMESGAMMVEFAIAGISMIFFLLAFFEVGRYFLLRGVLEAATDRASSIIASDPRFLDTEHAGIANSDFEKAKTNLDTQIRSILRNSFTVLNPGQSYEGDSSAVVNLGIPVIPAASNVLSQEQALLNTPVVYQLNAQIKPIFPCAGWLLGGKDRNGGNCNVPFSFATKSSAFKEPTKALTFPSPVDCKGNPVGSANYNPTECSCDPDKRWDSNTDRCVCYNDQNNAGQCTCGTNYSFDDVTKSCKCTLTASSCGNPNESLVGCGCECTSGIVRGGSGNCDTCQNANQVVNSGICSCPANAAASCRADQVLDPTTCQCVCASGITEGPGNICNTCVDSNRQFQNGNCNTCTQASITCNNASADTTNCRCNCNWNDQWYCQIYSGGIWNPNNCTCDCGSPDMEQVVSNGIAFCECKAGKQRSYVNGVPTCKCGSSMIDDGIGGCKCAGSGILNQAYQHCFCPWYDANLNFNSELYNQELAKCTPGQILDFYTCGCTCAGGQ